MTFIISIYDTETTGLHSSRLIEEKHKPELIEFSAVKIDIDTKTRIKEYDFLVKPVRPISAESVKITGITDDMVKDCLPFANHVSEIRDALENCDAVLAHNLSFDMEMIDTEFERCGMKLKWPDRKICTVEETICMKGYRMSLSDLHKELCGMSFEGAHRAMQDVNALVRCVEILFDRGFI